jgi:hypothetical protein
VFSNSPALRISGFLSASTKGCGHANDQPARQGVCLGVGTLSASSTAPMRIDSKPPITAIDLGVRLGHN